MKLLGASSTYIVLLAASTEASKLVFNYYSDHFCKNYQTSMDFYPDTMASLGKNCLNHQQGSSMTIANCYPDQPGYNWCVCLMYWKKDCSGAYSSLQYSGYNQPEDNCLYNAGDFQSYRCYSY